jgi:4a-hydroxytetrahydrobiopterin dehydratase
LTPPGRARKRRPGRIRGGQRAGSGYILPGHDAEKVGMSLTQKTCVPCQGGIPPLGKVQAQDLMAQVPGWTLSDAGDRITRRFGFDDFRAAISFVDRVGALAEEEQHHPDILFGWGYAEITFFTHKIKGLHENDFIMAAKVNAL